MNTEHFRFRFLGAVLAGLVLLGFSSFLRSPEYKIGPGECVDPLLVVTADSTYLTQKPSSLSEKLAIVHRGDSLLAVDFNFPFWQVEFEDVSGWINLTYVRANDDANALKASKSNAPVASPSSSSSQQAKKASPPPRQTKTCCRTCRKGKACGNSCIARNKTCLKGPGCACNG